MDELRWSLLILGVLVVSGILAREYVGRWWRLGWRRWGVPMLGRGRRVPARPADPGAHGFSDDGVHDGPPRRRADPDILLTEPGTPMAPAGDGPGMGDLDSLTDLDALMTPRRGRRAAAPAADAGGQVELPFDADAGADDEEEDTDSRLGGQELIVALHVMQPQGLAFAAEQVREALEAVGMRYGAMRIYHHYGVGQSHSSRPVFSAAKAVEPGHFDTDYPSSFATPGLVLFMRLPGRQDGAVTLELLLATAERLAQLLHGVLLDDRRSALTAQAVRHLRDTVAEFERRQRVSAATAGGVR